MLVLPFRTNNKRYRLSNSNIYNLDHWKRIKKLKRNLILIQYATDN